MTVAVFAAFAF